MSDWRDARNILAVRMDNIGDVIMLGPALRAVANTSPQARITLLASPAGTTGAALLPWVDEVITWRALWQDLGQLPFDPARELELVATLRERSFDAALTFTSFSQTPHMAGYVCYLAGIPLRAGESKEFGGAALTTELRGAPDSLHQAERNLRLVEALGFVADDRHLEVQIPDGVRAATTFILRDAGIDPDEPFMLIHPGASATARRYPTERFAAVASLLLADGLQVLITGSDRERTLLDPMRTLALGARFVVGGTSVPEYAAIVERAALVVCNDSLPMHLADALRTPMIVLFSGTDLESQWEPRVAPARLLRHETSCSPCYRFDCPIGLPCLDFTPEAVAGHVLRMLHEPAAVLHGARS